MDVHKEAIHLRVVNLSHEPKTIRRGTTVAKCKPINCVSIPEVAPSSTDDAPGPVRRASFNEIPHHLEPLLLQSTEGLSVEKKKTVCQLLCEFFNLFSTGPRDIRCTSLAKHRIQTGDAKPIRQPPQRLPLSRREEAEEAVIEMEQQGVTERSTSDWSSPVVLVTKKDGTTQFCVEYRKLNDVTQKDSYPLPRIDDTIDALSGAQWFFTLDLKSSYWQVPLEEDAKEETAF